LTARADGYARGARVLSIGIASTGVFTFAYFAVSSHVLGKADYGAISLLWSVLFVVLAVIYRPVEQLLARTIAARRAEGRAGGHPLRTPATIQIGFACLFVALALALRGSIEDALDSEALYWVFVVATIAYAASYFARGWFAGHQWFGLYGGLVLFESVSRFCFPLAVAVGAASGQTAVAVGIAAAPVASLLVLPWALARGEGAGEDGREQLPMREGGGFALGVAGIQLAEQTLLNAAVVIVAAQADSALAGVVFSALLIVRAPLQLFQAVQTSLLPHLAGGGDARHAIRVTLLAIVGFSAAVALGLLAVGPWVMDLLFDDLHDYGRGGLALLGVAMGLHLAAGTLNQAMLAAGRHAAAAVSWLVAAAVFVAFMIWGPCDDLVVRTEVGYLVASAFLLALLVGQGAHRS
jgi:O-antigen/teichoic acid export membrane protein